MGGNDPLRSGAIFRVKDLRVLRSPPQPVQSQGARERAAAAAASCESSAVHASHISSQFDDLYRATPLPSVLFQPGGTPGTTAESVFSQALSGAGSGSANGLNNGRATTPGQAYLHAATAVAPAVPSVPPDRHAAEQLRQRLGRRSLDQTLTGSGSMSMSMGPPSSSRHRRGRELNTHSSHSSHTHSHSHSPSVHAHGQPRPRSPRVPLYGDSGVSSSKRRAAEQQEQGQGQGAGYDYDDRGHGADYEGTEMDGARNPRTKRNRRPSAVQHGEDEDEDECQVEGEDEEQDTDEEEGGGTRTETETVAVAVAVVEVPRHTPPRRQRHAPSSSSRSGKRSASHTPGGGLLALLTTASAAAQVPRSRSSTPTARRGNPRPSALEGVGGVAGALAWSPEGGSNDYMDDDSDDSGIGRTSRRPSHTPPGVGRPKTLCGTKAGRPLKAKKKAGKKADAASSGPGSKGKGVGQGVAEAAASPERARPTIVRRTRPEPTSRTTPTRAQLQDPMRSSSAILSIANSPPSSRRSGRSAAASQPDEWSVDQLAALTSAHATTSDKKANLWAIVAAQVAGKTTEACEERWRKDHGASHSAASRRSRRGE